MLLGRKVQANWVTVLSPRFRWVRISFSDMPRIRLRSSLLTASAWQRSLNSQDEQWEFRISNGGEVDSICFLSLSRVCRASLTRRGAPVGPTSLILDTETPVP